MHIFNKTYLIISLTLLTLFAIFTLGVKLDYFTQFDFDTTVRIQDNLPEKLKSYLIKLVPLGSWQITSILVFISMLLLKKKFWIIGFTYIAIALIEIIGKEFLHHPPPPQFMLLRFQDLNIDPYIIREGVASYPSGHAARTAFLSFIWIPTIISFTKKYIKRLTSPTHTPFEITLPFGFKLSKESTQTFSIQSLSLCTLGVTFLIASLIFSLIIGFIKVYLGEHWMTDIIGGWLLGSGLALIPYSLLISNQTFFKEKSTPPSSN